MIEKVFPSPLTQCPDDGERWLASASGREQPIDDKIDHVKQKKTEKDNDAEN